MSAQPVHTALVCCLFALNTTAFCDTLQVPSEYLTIQSAFDAIPLTGGADWIIEIDPGTYTENLDLSGKTCIVTGLGNPGDVVIDANMSGSAMEITNTPTNGAIVLQNLDVINGTGVPILFFTFGGGIYVGQSGNAVLYGCYLANNSASFGGGIYVDGTASLFSSGNSYLDNSGAYGGGIDALGPLTLINDYFHSNSASNGGHLYLASTTESTTITDSSFLYGNSTENGGAILLGAAGELTLGNCDISFNSATARGGAISASDPLKTGGTRSLEIEDCLFESNNSESYGGAVSFRKSGSMNVSNTDFLTNEAKGSGTACELHYGSFSFTDNCSFVGQWMSDEHDLPYRNGAAVHGLLSDSLTITDASFTSNSVLDGTGAMLLQSCIATLTNVHFDGNSGTRTDAIASVQFAGEGQSGLTMTDCLIENHNTSSTMWVSNCWLTALRCSFQNNDNLDYWNPGTLTVQSNNNSIQFELTDCVFNQNTSERAGAALFLDSLASGVVRSSQFENNSAGWGGAIAGIGSAFLNIQNSSLSNNQASTHGGALRLRENSSFNISGSTFENNNSSKEGGAVCDQTPSSTMTDCLIRSNASDIGAGGLYTENGALLVSGTTICGNTITQVDGNFIDLGGNSIQNSCNPCIADLNSDGLVDGSDLASLLGSWGACAGCNADIEVNGTVDGADLASLLGAWGKCPK